MRQEADYSTEKQGVLILGIAVIAALLVPGAAAVVVGA